MFFIGQKPFCFSRRLYSERLQKRCASSMLLEEGIHCSRLRKGKDVLDATMFQALAMQIEKLMYHVSHAYLQNPADCADAVQETLMKAWQKRHTLRDERQFQPWIIRILRNQCKDMLKKRKRESLYPLEEDTALQEGPEPAHPVMEAVEKLPPEQKILILLHYREGHSLLQISEEMHLRMGTIKSRMRSARKTLSHTLLIEWEETI